MRAKNDYSGAIATGTASPWSSRALAVGGGIAMLSAAALLAAVLAWWGWRWLGPAPNDFVPAGPQDPALALLASGLFTAPAGAPAAPEAPVRSGGGDMRLLGVLAEEGDKGFALFRLPGGPRLVAAGAAIADDATLVSVQRDGVTIRDATGERKVLLRPVAAAPASRSAGQGRARRSPPSRRRSSSGWSHRRSSRRSKCGRRAAYRR